MAALRCRPRSHSDSRVAWRAPHQATCRRRDPPAAARHARDLEPARPRAAAPGRHRCVRSAVLHRAVPGVRGRGPSAAHGAAPADDCGVGLRIRLARAAHHGAGVCAGAHVGTCRQPLRARVEPRHWTRRIGASQARANARIGHHQGSDRTHRWHRRPR